jgi:hypothetical protein
LSRAVEGIARETGATWAKAARAKADEVAGLRENALAYGAVHEEGFVGAGGVRRTCESGDDVAVAGKSAGLRFIVLQEAEVLEAGVGGLASGGSIRRLRVRLIATTGGLAETAATSSTEASAAGAGRRNAARFGGILAAPEALASGCLLLLGRVGVWR